MTLRLLALFAFVAALVTGTSTAAHACKCAQMSPRQAVEHADAVFTGTVIAGHGGEIRSSAPSARAVYVFRADNVYKGQAAAEFTLATSTDSASCGYAFTTGMRYLVFATSHHAGTALPGVTLSSSACAGNMPIAPGTGPLQIDGAPGSGGAHHADAELVAALGTPTAVGGHLPSAAQTRSGSSAARDRDRGWTAATVPLGAAAVIAAVIAAVVVLRRRRRVSHAR
ncbi:hypothetical protein [Nonomuraea sp. NPDC050202]|uniref:hypothetical protein n=1 Tax=Nonomuraea sp. NPDC050202 TaxID=3155035 RepID=UPI0033F85906